MRRLLALAILGVPLAFIGTAAFADERGQDRLGPGNPPLVVQVPATNGTVAGSGQRTPRWQHVRVDHDR